MEMFETSSSGRSGRRGVTRGAGGVEGVGAMAGWEVAMGGASSPGWCSEMISPVDEGGSVGVTRCQTSLWTATEDT